VVDVTTRKGLTKCVGSVYGKKDTSEPDTGDNCHLGFNHMSELDMSVKENTKRSLDTRCMGSSDGGNDLFSKRSAVGLVVEYGNWLRKTQGRHQ